MKIILSIFILLITGIGWADSSSDVINTKLNKTFNSFCTQNDFSGTMLVARNGKIIFEKACGLASRSFQINNKIDTKFNLGSLGKIFTSVAIAQLIQNNKLSLDTPVYKILPKWLPKDERSHKITVAQLLQHSSGLGNFMNDKRWKLGADSGLYVSINDYMPLIREDKILFTPGTSQSYSNNGYILLGAIIENISGLSYADYLEKNIFTPASFKNTGLWRLDEIIPNRAEGYFQVCEKGKCFWRNNNFEAPFVGSSAGGAYSTVDDLFQLSESLHNSKLLNRAFSQKILSDQVISTSSDIQIKPYKIDELTIPENFSAYGFAGAWNEYGLAVWQDPSLVGHTGGIEGASAFFATSPDNHYTIIILSNTSGSAPIILYKNTREILGFSKNIMNY